MRLPRILHDDAVTILHTVPGGAPDADGVPTHTTTETTWDGVNVQQLRADEIDDEVQDTDTVFYRVSGPPATVAVGDRIRWDGTEYLIQGEPDTRTGRHRIERTTVTIYHSRG